MLTGLEEPTRGEVEILGLSLRGDWSLVQRLVGLCPQQSVLYPDLTASEHLYLYGRLKAGEEEEDGGDGGRDAEVEAMLSSMALTEPHSSLPTRSLSEGLRRRVCVALAFVGDPRVVVLDEPTAGIDPVARRCADY